jgi:hypothetical protein
MSFPFKTLPGLLAVYVTVFAVACFWIVAGAPRNWGATLPDDVHTYGIRFPRGADLFFRPSVGWGIEHGFQVCLALAAFAVVVEVIARVAGRTRRT